jgi:SAM-dependent methyltransferase
MHTDPQRRDETPGTDSSWDAVGRTVADAEQYVDAGSRVPPMRTLSALTRALVTPFVKLFLRVSQLVVREQQSFNVETIRAIRALTDASRRHLLTIEHRLDGAERAHESRRAVLEHAIASAVAKFEYELQNQHAAIDQGVANATQRADSLEHALWTWRQESLARFDEETGRAAEERERLRTQLLAHERQLGILDDAVGSRAPSPAGGDVADGLPARLDAFYLAFEDRFRGPRDEIRARVAAHLPIVREAGAGTPDRPIVDLGCGRGEWLELLAAEGLTARGVDANVATVSETRGRGLDVVQGDVLAHLRSLPDASCGAVTGFHVVEHLPFATVVGLVDEIVRVLQPGGVTILETPNPTNLQVGASSFYIDPTHGRPLHPETMRFLLTARGLERVDVRFLHPIDDRRLPDDGDPIAARLNEHLYGAQDYAVVGYRR